MITFTINPTTKPLVAQLSISMSSLLTASARSSFMANASYLIIAPTPMTKVKSNHAINFKL